MYPSRLLGAAAICCCLYGFGDPATPENAPGDTARQQDPARQVAHELTPRDSTADKSEPAVAGLEPDGADGATRPAGINSSDRETNPLVTRDGRTIFFNSTRKGDRPWAQYRLSGLRYDDDIYYSTRLDAAGEEERWSEPVNLGPTINSGQDDGVCAISSDGHQIYFSALKRGWEADGGPFYRAELIDGAWSNVRGLAGGITEFFVTRDKTAGFRMYGATMSSDGRDFYFATTVRSWPQRHQIWVSRLADGVWSYPENLGPNVNSGEGDYAPYISPDGGALYFTSSRGGAGDDDIYVSRLKDGIWGAPENAGSMFNTSGDDGFLSMPASGDRVYLSRAVRSDEDIYVIRLKEGK